MIEREPFTGPGGTLFLVGRADVLLTTLDGDEATVPLADFAALLQHLVASNAVAPLKEPDPPVPFRLLDRGI